MGITNALTGNNPLGGATNTNSESEVQGAGQTNAVSGAGVNSATVAGLTPPKAQGAGEDPFRQYVTDLLRAQGVEYRWPAEIWATFGQDKRDVVQQVRQWIRANAFADGGDPMGGLKKHITGMKNLPPDPRVDSVFEAPKDDEVVWVGQNFENLFDPKDDPNKKDEDFTLQGSKGNYGPDDYKNHRKAFEIIHREIAGGQGPGVMAAVEIEGQPVADTYAEENLAGLNYKPYVGGMAEVDPDGQGPQKPVKKYSDGEDMRGIRNGTFSQYPLWPGTEVAMVLTDEVEGERGVQIVQLDINGQRTIMCVNHWKSMRDGEDVAVAQNKIIAAALKAKLQAIVGEATGVDEKDWDKIDLGLRDYTQTIVDRGQAGPPHPMLPAGSHGGGKHEPEFLDRVIANEAAGVIPESVTCIPSLARGLTKDNDYRPGGTSDHGTMAFKTKPNASKGIAIVCLGDFNTKFYGDNSNVENVLGAKKYSAQAAAA